MPKNKDPFAERESKKYLKPIPSREFILSYLGDVDAPITLESLAKELKIKGAEETEALRRRLIAMSRDGQIIGNRKGDYCLPDLRELQKGVVQSTKDGVGYFIPEDGGDDLLLSLREMKSLFDGDKVLVRLNGTTTKGRKDAAVVEILQRRYSEILGRFYKEKSFGSVIAENKRINHELLIPENSYGKARDGDFVVAEIVDYPDRRRKAIGRIKEVLGDRSVPGLEVDIAIRTFDLPHVWPKAAIEEADEFPKEVTKEESESRFDLRDIPFVTIDGEDAKDFDDAVFTRQHGEGNWTLYVAIADVSHYVEIGSLINQEAMSRGTSVYFPGFVVPMLPEGLSNGLCSLKENVDRLSLVCEMEISKLGEIISYCFYEAVIHSHARMTYTDVADILAKPKDVNQENVNKRLRQKYAKLVSHIECLHALFQVRKSKRAREGAMDFESTETRVVFGEDKKLKEILPVLRNDAHRIIEECMLCANVSAALLLEKLKIPALYRIHEGPNPEKLDSVKKYLGSLGLGLGGGEKPNTRDYSKLLSKIRARDDSRLLHTMLIRSMMQAVYQLKNVGHFGLGFPAYTHFTSPIRRYPDLLVHRAIKYLIHNKTSDHLKSKNKTKVSGKKIYPYTEAQINEFGIACSNFERRADAASYSVLDWLKCEYMEDKVGDVFQGIITSVTSFGLFVELEDIFIEGLVHVTDLNNDYYHYDPNRFSLKGEKTKQIYCLGDKIEVRVARVDVRERKIDLQLSRLKFENKDTKGVKKNKKESSSKLKSVSKDKINKKRKLSKDGKRKTKMIDKKRRAKK